MAHAPLGTKDVAEVWKLKQGDLPHLILEVVAEPENRFLPLDSHPYMSPAETKLGHT
jgi:hypothetical protein